MPARLQCPACSGPLDLPHTHSTTVRCPYCGTGVLLTERLGRVEASAAHEGHPETIAEVVRLLRAGRKIEAVKLYRERFGGGLKEAKDAVERIAAGQPPGTLPAPASPKWFPGCMVVLLLIVLGVAVVLATRRTPDPPAAAEPMPVPAGPAASVPQPEPEPPRFAEPVLRFGSEGTGAGRFTDARSVAVDGQGRIYVAEYSGGRVQVFDSLGTFLTQWTADPKMPLVDLEADRGGTVYVVQRGDIRRYEGATGKALGELASGGRASYSDVAPALDGTFWAVTWPHGVVHLDRDGSVLRTLDIREVIGDDASPARVAVAGTGDLYVTDQWTGEIYRLDRSGRFVDRFGDRRAGSTSHLAVDGRGRVYVSDLGSGIRVFDPDGRQLASFADGVVFGIAINDRDEIFAALRNRHEVVKYRLRE